MMWRQLTSVMAAMAALVLARGAADQVDLAKLCHDAPGSGLVKLEEICAALRTILRSASGKYGVTASQYITQNSMRSLVLFSHNYGAKGYSCLKYACAIMMHYRFLLMVTFDQLKALLLELCTYSGLKGDSRKKIEKNLHRRTLHKLMIGCFFTRDLLVSSILSFSAFQTWSPLKHFRRYSPSLHQIYSENQHLMQKRSN